jgi:hypothetical protein
VIDVIARASSRDADVEALVGEALKKRSLATTTRPPKGTSTVVHVAGDPVGAITIHLGS